jgi:hypothetical protein
MVDRVGISPHLERHIQDAMASNHIKTIGDIAGRDKQILNLIVHHFLQLIQIYTALCRVYVALKLGCAVVAFGVTPALLDDAGRRGVAGGAE